MGTRRTRILVPDKTYDVMLSFEDEYIYFDEKICEHVVGIIALILII